MKKKNFILLAAALLSGALLSCSSDVPEVNEEKEIVNLLSEAKPVHLTQQQRVFVNDNNRFTLNFLKTVNETDHSGKSFIYSPLSITYVLGMANAASTGLTEQELEQTLGFHEGGIQAVNDYCKNLIDNLPNVDKDVTLNIANAIFLNKKFTLKKQFQDDMKQYYSATAEALDFSSPSTLTRINNWANEKTNGMIPTILDQVNPRMVSYLLNAIYFKADWTSKFDEKNTRNETFTNEKGVSKQMPMMHQGVLISYLKNNTYAAVKIPYGNSLWNMTVMLPEEGKTTDDIINLLAERGLYMKNYPGGEGDMLQTYEVDLKMPRYETSSDTDFLNGGLIALLTKMGIHRAFDSDLAEIPNMANVPVFISMMRQKAKIKVNEEGSEAAAVTVGGFTNTSIGPDPEPVTIPKADFHANRPFVYVISEASSGVILFVGKFTGEGA
ncbi:MAG: serpin family protein [Prevotella sp.]|nr:serpin family protein [Prevotella sp.]